MEPESVIRIVQELLLIAALISAPPILAALAVGLVLSIFQAATQIQDPNLTMVPKIVAVYIALAVFGLWIVGVVVRFTLAVLDLIPRIA